MSVGPMGLGRHHVLARGLVVAASVGVFGLAPTRARACSFERSEPIALARPSWPADSGLELVDERIEVECGTGLRERHCRWRSVWVYERSSNNSSTAEIEGELRWPSSSRHEYEQLRLSVDGEPVEIVDERWQRQATLHVESQAPVEVELELELEVMSYNGNPCSWEAGYVRHPLVGREPHYVQFVILEGESPEAPTARTQLEVRAPPTWRVEVESGPESSSRILQTTVASAKLRHLTLDNRELGHGPFVAAGVGFGPTIRPRLRAGYEVAAPPFMLYSLAVEGDAKDELMLIPAVELASMSMAGILPSAGIGIGLPVMLLPEPRPGFRAQLSAMWPFVGLVGSVDVYPRPGTPAVRGALLLQVEL